MRTDQKRELAKQLFLHTSATRKEIAARVGVSEKTISGATGWIKKFDWDKLKSALTVTRDNLVASLYNQILKITELADEEDRTLTTKETDALVKIAKAIETIDEKTTVSTFIQVFMEFEKWLIDVDSDLCKAINEHHNHFINTRIGG